MSFVFALSASYLGTSPIGRGILWVAVELVHVVRFRGTDALRKVNVLSPLRSLRVAFSDGRMLSSPTVMRFGLLVHPYPCSIS